MQIFSAIPRWAQPAAVVLLGVSAFVHVPRGRTYYVSPAGSDDAACEAARNIETPRRTLKKAAECLNPGDTLLVRSGVYAENLDDAIPSGSSWAAPVKVAAYPGETVTVEPTGGQFVFQSTRGSYIVLDGLILDGRNVRYDAVQITFGPGRAYAHHIRIANSEIRYAPRTGVGIHQGDAAHRTDYNEFINVLVHDNGTTDLHHGFYIESSYNLIERANVYNNSGWGVHVYTAAPGMRVDGNIIRNSSVRSNARSAKRGVGIGLYNGVGNVACNNIVQNNSGGIAVNYGAAETRVCKNIVLDNNRGVNRFGIYNGNDSDLERVGAAGSTIVDNVIEGNAQDLVNARPDATLENNVVGAGAREKTGGRGPPPTPERPPGRRG